MTRETDIDTLARTIWAEARGEGVAGMEAVAAVIMNRVNLDLGKDGKPDWWGEGVESVCRKPWQFSCWNEDDPNLGKLIMVKASEDGWFAHAVEIAKRAIAGELVDRTGGATHYCTKAVADRTAWAKGRAPVADIGRHLFFKL
jgi:N-acetylmuramoyl-L-alanine amidase